tara:strand:+ start:85 stop:663 length:579 start_codon:yes stop_codon:yes gene_type:complete
MDTSYENGKIYKIVDFTNDNFYVGSTNYVRLCSRLTKHKGNLKAYMNGSSLKYCASMEILINENYKILLLEPYPCKNRDELRMREQEWMDKLRCDKMVNKQDAYVSKEDMLIKKKQCKIDNKEQYQKQQRQYRKDNLEMMKERERESYQKHKDIKNARKQQKIECPNCKSIVSRGNLSQHKKSQRCLDFVEK